MPHLSSKWNWKKTGVGGHAFAYARAVKTGKVAYVESGDDKVIAVLVTYLLLDVMKLRLTKNGVFAAATG